MMALWHGFWLAWHRTRSQRLTERADQHLRKYYRHGRLREGRQAHV